MAIVKIKFVTEVEVEVENNSLPEKEIEYALGIIDEQINNYGLFEDHCILNHLTTVVEDNEKVLVDREALDALINYNESEAEDLGHLIGNGATLENHIYLSILKLEEGRDGVCEMGINGQSNYVATYREMVHALRLESQMNAHEPVDVRADGVLVTHEFSGYIHNMRLDYKGELIVTVEDHEDHSYEVPASQITIPE